MIGTMPFERLRIFKVNKWVAEGDSENLGPDSLSMIEEVESLDDAQIVSSQFRADEALADLHMLVLDLDVPAALIPSSTPGHSHLFIGQWMAWERYERVLDALVDAGIVESGYVDASKARGFTAVRLPWVHKDHVTRRTRCRAEHIDVSDVA